MAKRKCKEIGTRVLACLLVWCTSLSSAAAEVTLCAEVKIEIQQELTLERQAFDARMLITNGLTDFSIDEVKIDVIFKDSQGNLVTATSDPDNLSALFFITVSSLSGINSVSGSGGTIPPQTSAEIHWLIIPAAGAAAGSPLGELYFVGALVSYKTNGELTEVNVASDVITVLPQPELFLEYFLPYDVYGDDPLTPQVEPIVPFTLGVRIKNGGLGVAKNLKITSSQPKIVENLLGLLINFQIVASFVDDAPAQPTLKLDFGDIEAGTFRAGRWLMQTTLAGKFTDFDASFSHSDELGGALTSLLKSVHKHTLLKDVLVDLPGRDSVKDFLTVDPLVYRMFESEGIDNIVNNYSGLGTITPQGSAGGIDTFSIDVPPTAGMFFLSAGDPYLGNKAVISVVREDGKNLPSSNAWFYAHGLGPQKQFYFGLFDSNGGGHYTVKIGNPPNNTNKAPVLDPIANQTIKAGTTVKFNVHASDPDGTLPLLTTGILPIGANFTILPNGDGHFSWNTKKSQSGNFPVTFHASDGVLKDTKTALIKVSVSQVEPPKDPNDPVPDPSDTDKDGLSDAWELEHFGDLNQKQSDDFDGDTLTNGREFKLGTDPTWAPNAPSVPFIKTPLYTQSVFLLQPTLTVETSAHGVQVPTYEFEVASDIRFTDIVTTSPGVQEQPGTTSWKVDKNLKDGERYFWRARAKLPTISSNWIYGEFLVDTGAAPGLPPIAKATPISAPSVTPTPQATPKLAVKKPQAENPADTGRVDTLRPKLSVLPSDIVSTVKPKYRFQLYSNKRLTNLVTQTLSGERFWKLTQDLKNFRTYFWRVRSEVNGKASQWSKTRSFFVSKDAVNNPPRIELISPSEQAFITQGDALSFILTAFDSDSETKLQLLVNNVPFAGFVPGDPVYGDNYNVTFNNINVPLGVYALKLVASDELSVVETQNSCDLTVGP
jgi:hypothetical protein